MLNSAQNTDICIRFDVCWSASGYVYGTHCSTCAPISASLSVEHVVKSVFWAEWENSPPEVSAISSAYVYQWLMTAPLHWQRRQQQKHQNDRQKKGGKKDLKEKEETKSNVLYKRARAVADCIGEFEAGGCKDMCLWVRTRESDRKKGKEAREAK